MDTHSEFSKEEAAILADLLPKEGGQEAQAPAPEPVAPAPAAEAAPSPAPAGNEASGEPQAPAPSPGGDVRAALRASRRAEHRAREQAARLQAEIEDLRNRLGAAPDPNRVTDDELRQLQTDFPADEFPLLDKLKRENDALRAEMAKRPAPAPVQQPEFVPPKQALEVQEAIDEVPELLGWQQSAADQEKFGAAIRMDAYLRSLPAWQDKPLAQRLAEVTRRVKQELMGTPAPSASAPNNAREVIANAPAASPQGIADLRGGALPTRNAPDYSRMTDEQIIAALPVI